MKFQEKLLYCRKRAGLSQEALAAQLGVSRQSVSKWELGDAVPEISKLLLLANTFGVTTDWLLYEEKSEESKEDNKTTSFTEAIPTTSWVDSVPGVIGKILRRFGWLYGIYMTISGALFAGIGTLMRYIDGKFFSDFSDFGDVTTEFFSMSPEEKIIFNDFSIEGFEVPIDNVTSKMAQNSPVSTFSTIIIWFGIVMVIAGIILTIILLRYKKKGEKQGLEL